MRQTKPKSLKRDWQETKKLWLQQNAAIQKRYFVFFAETSVFEKNNN